MNSILFKFSMYLNDYGGEQIEIGVIFWYEWEQIQNWSILDSEFQLSHPDGFKLAQIKPA